MDLGINGRTALVLGASGGLGGAIAVAGRSADALAATAARIEQAGAKALPPVWDLGDLRRMEAAVAEVESAFGPIEILVNNTGGPPPTPKSGQDTGTWQNSFQAMVLAVIALTDRLMPGMRERGWGRVLTSTSSGALSPIPNLELSNTLRASLHAWSKTLADEVGRDGVTSNVIVPGRIATDRTRFLDEKRASREERSVEEVARASAATMALGRYGRPDEYADAAAFLCSDRASYITGTVAFGPDLITLDEALAYGPLEDLRVATIHNGAVHREHTVSGMTFSPAELLSFHSQVMPFYPGDILSTGTPGAVGIAPGDVVRCELGTESDLADQPGALTLSGAAPLPPVLRPAPPRHRGRRWPPPR